MNNNLRLLFIHQNDAGLLNTIQTHLSGAGRFQVELSVAIGVAAAKPLLGKKFDLYIIALDKNEGLDLLRHGVGIGIRSPMILLADHIAHEFDEESFQSGAHDLIEKENFKGALLDRILRSAFRHKHLERELSQKKEENREISDKYKGMYENAVEGIFQTSFAGKYLSANPALAKIYGYESPEDLVRNVSNIAGQVYVEPGRREIFKEEITRHGRVSNFESQVYRKDGKVIWISENARIERDPHDDTLYYEGTVVDITDRKEAELRLLESAFRDNLTGLPNRAKFALDVDLSLAAVQEAKDSETRFAVFFINLDGFKIINDSLGNLNGDLFLRDVSERFRCFVPTQDVAARLGGDEFAILLRHISGEEEARLFAKKIMKELMVPLTLSRKEILPSASIGIVLSNRRYTNAGEILRDASTAMFYAKRRGRSQFEIFDPAMHYRDMQRLDLENEFRQGLAENEFRVYYQPIVDSRTKKIIGFESLVRWEHPLRGLLAPSHFITLAEETGLITELGEQILKAVFDQHKAWRAAGHEHLFASVNFSVRQLQDASLLERIKVLLKETGMPENRLKIEVTESMALDRSEQVYTVMQELGRMGVHLSIDDFGTGFSSLGNLKKYPFATIKIDKTFVENLPHSDEDKSLVRAMISMAHDLRLQVIAEGVETEEQHQYLEEAECDAIQGYFHSRPVPAEEFTRLLESQSLN